MTFQYTAYVNSSNNQGTILVASTNDACEKNMKAMPALKDFNPEKLKKDFIVTVVHGEYAVVFGNRQGNLRMTFLHYEVDLKTPALAPLLATFGKQLKKCFEEAKEYEGEIYSSVHFHIVPLVKPGKAE